MLACSPHSRANKARPISDPPGGTDFRLAWRDGFPTRLARPISASLGESDFRLAWRDVFPSRLARQKSIPHFGLTRRSRRRLPVSELWPGQHQPWAQLCWAYGGFLDTVCKRVSGLFKTMSVGFQCAAKRISRVFCPCHILHKTIVSSPFFRLSGCTSTNRTAQ